MRIMFGMALAVGLAAATGAGAKDACKLLTQGTNRFCATIATSAFSGTNQDTISFGPNNSFSIQAAATGTGTFFCPGRSFIEVDYTFNGGESDTWYGKAPNGAMHGNGYGKSTFSTVATLYKWTLTPGKCH